MHTTTHALGYALCAPVSCEVAVWCEVCRYAKAAADRGDTRFMQVDHRGNTTQQRIPSTSLLSHPQALMSPVRISGCCAQLWAGQSYPWCDELSAADMVAEMLEDVRAILHD